MSTGYCNQGFVSASSSIQPVHAFFCQTKDHISMAFAGKTIDKGALG
jgi:hypothetical protein